MAVTYDKKKLIILRAVLIVFGACVGCCAMWQYFECYPGIMRDEFEIPVIAVTGTAFAAILGLSAKPFYRLGASIAYQFIGLTSRLGGAGAAAVISGLATAGMFGYLFDFAIRGVIGILAVRVLLDGLVIAALAALCCYGFIKWMASADGENEDGASSLPRVGYLLTASCFSDDRVISAVDVLIGAKISSSVFKAVWQYGDDAAAERLKTVAERADVKIVKCGRSFETPEEYVSLETETAAMRRLIPVSLKSDVYPELAECISLSVFACPEEKPQAGETGKDGARDAEAAAETCGAAEIPIEPQPDEPNGEIIIDK